MTRCLRNLALATTALLPLGIGFAVAGPEGGSVVGGGATISGQGSGNVTINQSTPRAIINWNTFNIGAGETTQFNQPNSSSVTLNRVTGGLGPSQIDGTLTANGRVFLVNRDGVLFGGGAVVNTAGFLATTSDIKNSDFMAGKYNFNIPGRPDASIVNHGTITAHSAGFAALVAPGVRNTGTITATMGTVALAAGNGFTLDFYGDKLITLAVGDSIAGQVRDVQTGLPLSSLVENSGKLSANGGRVELTAAAARHVVDSVINNKGIIEANTIGQKGGTIVLGAATAGAGLPKQTVKLSGTISAAGKEKGEKGGKVVVTGEDIRLTGAKVDVSGKAGGGTALIGGDQGGKNPDVANASTVTIDKDTVINASATDSGDGGKVIVWSDASTSFAGLIAGTGGPNGGNGGFVEVSGKHLDYTGLADLRAAKGKVGTLLLDPADYYIVADDGGPNVPDGASSMTRSTLQNQLALADVTIETNNSASFEGQNGDIRVTTSLNWSSNNSLTLSAYRDITLSPGVTISNTYTGADARTLLTMRADNTGRGEGTVNFQVGGFQCGQCFNPSKVDFSQSTGKVAIFYNPPSFDGENKYLNPNDYSGKVMTNPNVPNQLLAYMLVNNSSDLQAIGQSNFTRAQNYALGQDINASGISGWNPIGNGPSNSFNGRFNGQGHNISNLTIAPTATNIQNVGLFGVIGAGAVVQDFNLVNVHVTANPNIGLPGQFVGTVAGSNAGTVSNVTVTGTVNGMPDGESKPGVIAGGVIGQNGVLMGNNSEQTPGTVTNVDANVTVTVGNGTIGSNGGWNSAGGLVGSNVAGSTIANSRARGTVTGGNYASVGGLVGQNGFAGTGGSVGFIRDSFATGNVNNGAFGMAGGLVGSQGPGSKITDSQAFGIVTANANGTGESFAAAGGLVGQNEGTITSTTAPTASSNCAQGSAFSCATGAVSVAAGGNAGGLVGHNSGLIERTFATGAVSGGADSAIGGLVGANFCDGCGFNNANPTIVGSFASGNVTGGGLAGGLVGDNGGIIDFSFATGAVRVNSPGNGDLVAGGLVGSNFGTISNSFATGSVTSTGGDLLTLGGFAGFNEGTITNSFATGDVKANNPAAFVLLGGFVGGN